MGTQESAGALSDAALLVLQADAEEVEKLAARFGGGGVVDCEVSGGGEHAVLFCNLK